MVADGHGARGIVFGQQPDVGHVFNVVNDSGSIVFLDHQMGGFAHLEDFERSMFMPTCP